MPAEDPTHRKIPLIFYRLRAGHEPVREWLKELQEVERHAIGKDLVALHGFIKKTRTTPVDDLALARKRQKELER